VQSFFTRRTGAALAVAMLLAFSVPANADTKIVAIGASNTSGWGAGGQSYPTQLEAMLRAHGYKVQVVNAGVLGDTTRGMLARIDTVPAGGNDLRFGVSKEERASNIRAMVAQLQRRGIHVIVADNLQGLLAQHSFDGIHFNAEAHTIIAKKLYPQVVGALGGGTPASATPAAGGQAVQTPASGATR
jgi:acyl-CoA thioesterase-1